MLQFKALEVASERGFSAGIFTASYSWRKGVMRRHRLSIRVRTRQGQTTPEDADAVAAKFRAEVREMIVKYTAVNQFTGCTVQPKAYTQTFSLHQLITGNMLAQ
ncbi:Hypothetical protein PHPALM_2455 [Phytophthora palmivora]|uniref:HTH CENPB-type domain-containing protein n=1 Tax=Phytophthora palmivora TaxID=4796 RepID=A0A2P4YPP6_9STRA|nr:Hypothetical protein PHPALM_2455 [Phytophthora palmivora]